MTDYPWEVRKEAVLRRDGHQCRLCGSGENLHVHHITPVSEGGSDSFYNLVTLCTRCHGKMEYYDEDYQRVRIRRDGMVEGPIGKPDAETLRTVRDE